MVLRKFSLVSSSLCLQFQRSSVASGIVLFTILNEIAVKNLPEIYVQEPEPRIPLGHLSQFHNLVGWVKVEDHQGEGKVVGYRRGVLVQLGLSLTHSFSLFSLFESGVIDFEFYNRGILLHLD